MVRVSEIRVIGSVNFGTNQIKEFDVDDEYMYILSNYGIFVYTILNTQDFSHTHKLFYFLDYLGYFLTGMIITFVYFTDVSKEFEKK